MTKLFEFFEGQTQHKCTCTIITNLSFSLCQGCFMSVCSFAGHLKKLWMDFHEILWYTWALAQ